MLVEAFERLPEAWAAHLVLIGSGMDAAPLARRIAASRAASRIHVLGFRRDARALTAAIERLHEDRELRRRLGAAARERIRQSFRIEDTITQTLELYRSLVRGSRASEEQGS